MILNWSILFSALSIMPNVTTPAVAVAADGNFSHRPPQVLLEVEKYPVAPDALELEQVQVFVRHGERTPVGNRMSASIPEHWNMCISARSFQAAVTGAENGAHDAYLRSRRVVENKDGSRAPGECLLGELTDVGRQSTYNFGLHLRKLYIEKLGFLPDILNDEDILYTRSTHVPRTVESLQQITHGLYPTEKCASGVVPPLLLRNAKDENLLGNTYSCARLMILQNGFAQAAASAYNHSLEPLDKRLSKYIGGKPIRVDGKPRASGIMDTIRAAQAHGVKVPPEFEEKAVVDTIERAVVNEWFGDKTEEVRRLGMGPMLSDITRKMQAKVDKDPIQTLLVHSTHDTALASLLSTLDVYDDKWPAFTAAVTFELFKKKEVTDDQSFVQVIFKPFRSAPPPPEHYVRMRYQNKNMVLPTCADEGKHLPGSPEFCTLSAFAERVKELTPLDWEAECSVERLIT